MTLNINQFAQTTEKGVLDLRITASGVIAGLISANQATALLPGARVKLDTAAGKKIPTFVAASDAEQAIGVIVRNVKDGSLVANDPVEVAFFGGPVMYMEAAAAISAGAAVEGTTDDKVQTFSSGKQVGIALDPASADGDLLRVIITTPSVIHA